jgi:hypothetical protein
MQDEFKQTMMFTRFRREQVGDQRAETWHKTNMKTSCAHPRYHQMQDYPRFGPIGNNIRPMLTTFKYWRKEMSKGSRAKPK